MKMNKYIKKKLIIIFMGNLCTKINDNEINIEERIIVEEIMPIDPNEFNSDYVIKWNDKKKILIYKTYKIKDNL